MENTTKATYKFKQFLYEKGFAEEVKIPCEILKENKKTYKIKILANIPGHIKGDEMQVHKVNVILPEPEKVKLPENEVAVEHYWWQDL